MIAATDYLRPLELWVRAARRHLRPLPGRDDVWSFGPGNHGHWAQQANATALGAFAELAVNPATDCARAGMAREELRERAMAMLRFALGGHLAGDEACVDGEKWGHSWISNLSVERMMHAVENLEPFFGEREREGLRRLLFSECDWLLDEYPVNAAPEAASGKNHPESNMWNGCVLWRTALRYPGAPRAAEYREKGTRFLLNALSMPRDAAAGEIFSGRPLKDWHVGANLFATGACNHHGYMNVGYLNVALSNLAMLHFSGRHYGWELPPALYLHLKDVWPLVKACVFPDGRLLRIGGDSRVRYCYCQDYAVMAWLLARDALGDADVERFEEGWLAQVRREQNANPDGSFLGRRLATLEDVSPLYYARLEGDKAASLSMACCWRRRCDEFRAVPAAAPAPALDAWEDAFHGSLFVRSQKRVAAWTWAAAEPPMGLCLPATGSDLAEWRFNLAGQIRGMGVGVVNHLFPVKRKLFPGGFLTSGHFDTQSMSPAAEGEANDLVARTRIACVALPDDATMVVLQRAVSLNRFYFRMVKGLGLNVLNGVQNGSVRELACELLPPLALRELPYQGETLICGGWLNFDGRLGVRSFAGALLLNRPRRPNVRIKSDNAMYERSGGQSYAEEVCAGQCLDDGHPRQYEPGAALFDVACALRANATVAETRAWAAEAVPAGLVACDRPEDLRHVATYGADGQLYVVLFNASDAPLLADVKGEPVALGPEEAAVLRG